MSRGSADEKSREKEPGDEQEDKAEGKTECKPGGKGDLRGLGKIDGKDSGERKVGRHYALNQQVWKILP